MQRFELAPNNTIRLLTREPLLIVQLPILKPGLPNTMIPVRNKSYQDHTFALRIPLEIDDDDLVSLKLDHLCWLHLLGEVLRSPILHYERDSSRSIFTCPLSPNAYRASSIWYLLDAYLEVAPQLDQFLDQLFFFYNDGVLKIHMRSHSILFFKTHSI
jgi:hypothetical protein